MIKVIEDEKKIELVSDFVSSVVDSNREFRAFEGAYVSCSYGLCVRLKLITNGWSYKPVYSEDDLDRISRETGFYISVERMAFSDFGNDLLSNTFKHPEKGMLKSGHIIYDRTGSLTKLQNEYRADSSIDDLSWRGVIEVEPPIQYIKK